MKNLYRLLPSVDACLKICENPPIEEIGTNRALLYQLINTFLDQTRKDIREGNIREAEELSQENFTGVLRSFVKIGALPHLRPVINATGVVIHTNMGRSVLSREAIQAVVNVCEGYSNLELDLQTGERGTRYSHLEPLICKITGAESALVVNNNAAAVLLTLDTLCSGGEVIISRGQLVEIGGSFRIPDIMLKSGAILHEVGCTNRVHPEDYESAINEKTKALLRVHTSNYRIIGFHCDVSLKKMVEIASMHHLPVIEDLGSGVLVDFSQYALPKEPTVQATIAEGAHIVTFSGDKVLGGPQAGIIIGKKEYIDQIKRNPLTRALRVDKMTFAALEATLRLYLDENLTRTHIPTLQMLTSDLKTIEHRCYSLLSMLQEALKKYPEISDKVMIDSIYGESRAGGGAFPERPIPTKLIRIQTSLCPPEKLKEYLIQSTPPILARIEKNSLVLDPRTILDREFGCVSTILINVINLARKTARLVQNPICETSHD